MSLAKIKKDDFVEVIAGKDKGRTGKVVKVYPDENKCLVEKMGLVKRHQKAKPTGGPAGIVEKPSKIWLSKVMLLDPKTKKPSRSRILEKDGKRLRQYVGSKEWVDAPTTSVKKKA